MLTLIPTPIGNIKDITFRSLEVLQEAQIVLCEDTRVTKQLLHILESRFDFKAPNAKFISFFEHNQYKKIEEIAPLLKEKKCVYLSDAGMPGISDPGALLVEFCQKNSISYDVLPGPSVAPLIYAASGFESGKFYFYGFLPKKGQERTKEITKVVNSPFDTIIYEAPHRILQLLEEILKIDSNKELFVAKEISKKFQKYFFGTVKEVLEEIKSSSTKGEWALVLKGSTKIKESSISLEEIKALDIPPKAKAKIIAKITNKSIKECYSELIN